MCRWAAVTSIIRVGLCQMMPVKKMKPLARSLKLFLTAQNSRAAKTDEPAILLLYYTRCVRSAVEFCELVNNLMICQALTFAERQVASPQFYVREANETLQQANEL